MNHGEVEGPGQLPCPVELDLPQATKGFVVPTEVPATRAGGQGRGRGTPGGDGRAVERSCDLGTARCHFVNHGEVEGRGPLPCPAEPDPSPATEDFVVPVEVPARTTFELPYGVGATAAEKLMVCRTLRCAHIHVHTMLSFCLPVIADGGLLECGTPARARWPVTASMCAAAARCG